MVNINIQKKDLWLISAIFVFLVGVGVVIGFGDYVGNEAQINGHSSDEIMVKNSSNDLVTLQSLIDGGDSEETYVSPWQSISTGESVTFNHELGTDELRIDLQFKPTATGVVSPGYSSDYGGSGYGVGVYQVTSSQIKVSGGNADLRYWRSDGKMPSYAGPSYVRIIATVV